jgi:hypothetical protein
MERYGIDERDAFELLRTHSRRTGRKLIDVAEAVTTSHLLLVREPTPASNKSQPPTLVEDVPSRLSKD